jgi:hypothetical protein
MLLHHLFAVASAWSLVALLSTPAHAQVVPHDTTLPDLAAGWSYSAYPASIATDGDLVVTTLAYTPPAGLPAGQSQPKRRMYVMRRAGDGSWLLEQELSPLVPNNAPLDIQPLDVSGDTILAGSHVFERSGGSWILATTLGHPSGISGSKVVGLGLEGSRITGCEIESNHEVSGNAFLVVWERSGSSWQLVARTQISPSNAGWVRFVSSSGDRVAIARVDTVSGNLSSISVNRRAANGVWSETHLLTQFGAGADCDNMHLDGDRLVLVDWNLSTGILELFEAGLASAIPTAFSLVGSFSSLASEEYFTGSAVRNGRALVSWEPWVGTVAGRGLLLERKANGTWIEVANLVADVGAPVSGTTLGDTRIVQETGGNVGVWSKAQVHTLELGTLLRGTRQASIGASGTQPLHVRAGAQRAGWKYLVLGSLSGTAPATPLGFGLELPLVVDAYTQLTLALRAPLSNEFGTLDANGRAAVTFSVPPGTSPSFAGLSVHHAYVAIDPVTYAAHASNAVRVDLVN